MSCLSLHCDYCYNVIEVHKPLSSRMRKLRAPRRFSRFSCRSSLSEGRCPVDPAFVALDLEADRVPLPLLDGDGRRAVE